MKSPFRTAPLVALIAVASALVGCKPTAAQPEARPPTTAAPAKTRPLLDSYPLVVVPSERLGKVRDFYTAVIGLDVVFDSTWFVALGDSSRGSIDLAIMAHDHPSNPPGPETFSGKGVVFTVQVTDARAAEARMVRAGATLVHPLTEEPWGQRRFMVKDPAGLAVDVVEQIEPAAGYWDRYSPRP